MIINLYRAPVDIKLSNINISNIALSWPEPQHGEYLYPVVRASQPRLASSLGAVTDKFS